MKKTHHTTAQSHLMHAHQAMEKGNAKTGMKHAFLAIKAMQGKMVPPIAEGMPGEPEPDQDVDDPKIQQNLNRPTSGGVY